LTTIPISRPNITAGDVRAVAATLSRGEVSGRAPVVAKFESAFSDYLGAEHAVACTNGTTALHLALAAIGLGPGDEVIVPDLTMISPVFAVSYTGARPIPADVNRRHWGLDPSDLEKRLSDRTRAIVAVHSYGNPVDMDPVLRFAEEHDLLVIEDCAEALGATYRGRLLGTLGHVGTFSFFANKLITSGEGGMVVTNDERLAREMRSLRDLRFGTKSKFEHGGLGFNCRMTAMQAALGLAQLGRIEEHLQKARWIARTYAELLKDIKGLQAHAEPPRATSSFWMYSVVLPREASRRDRDGLAERLAARGIETRPFFTPVHRQPFYRGTVQSRGYPVSAYLSARGLNLPSGLTLTEDEIRTVGNAVGEEFRDG
jgi:perosamine synthetase